MTTRVVKATGDPAYDREVMEEASAIIRAGGLVAIPTETVYGLAGDALNPDSARKIYAAKGRPPDNPLIVHIARLEDMERIARDIPGEAYALAERFWPGPLTMILNKKEAVPRETTGGLDTVAVRFPVNKIAQEFILAAGGFIAAPSANVSGRPSCTTAGHCIQDLDGRIDMIIDGGEVGIGLESTIVDMTVKPPCILRQGYINKDMLNEVLQDIGRDSGKSTDDGHPKAPGMKYRHYAPKGRLTIVRGDRDSVVSEINRLAGENERNGYKTAVIASHETSERYVCSGPVADMGSLEDEEAIARRLFAVLREMDDIGAEYIYSESFDTPRLGEAIMDRLIRASGNNVTEVGGKNEDSDSL
ncbi:MAG: threonylcarbamoyl-AMP synthase [Lachnospiraceae bacterium]|nr:threonylcarbamoyl-AMP synthase [Lachnospiraceae bacterium]